MTVPLRKGWCPGVLRPMAAKDGLLVRLRITGGILSADRALALADLVDRFGNGRFDLSSRGNLQLRGVRGETLPSLQDALSELHLVDTVAAGEAVRNVLASPLAGLHGGIDVRPLTASLEHRLSTHSEMHTLPSKFGFLIDDGSSPSMAGIATDVRFDWTGGEFSIALAGDASGAARIGHCAPSGLVAEAVRIAKVFLERFGHKPEIRRMRDAGPKRLADAYSLAPPFARGTSAHPKLCAPVVGLHTYGSYGERSRSYLGLAAPFGRLDAGMLRAAAALAAKTPVAELRMTPWRAILLPGATQVADVCGFVTDADDPRLAVAACVGIDGCERGTTRTRDAAARLARDLGLRPADGVALHVSGCAKGCAKATPSPITLVAREDRYDVVRNGRAGDAPWRTGLDIDAVRALLAAKPHAA